MKRIILVLFLLSGLFYLKSNGQAKYFQGSWTKINTGYLFEFNLNIDHSKEGKVLGVFFWTVKAFDDGSTLSRDHYKDRLDLKAKEYVKGKFNNATQEYHLKGYKKEDPNQIIGLDSYILKIESNGIIHGKTKANNSWQGRIKGKELESYTYNFR